MIRSITVTNHLGESLELVLGQPELSGLAVGGIQGLGPVPATVNITDFSLTDGGVFNSSRLSSRTITINLVMLWYYGNDIETLRQKAYKYFPIKKKVELRIVTDNRDVTTEGIVEKHEPDIFSNNESTDITITCPDPYFYGVNNNGDFVYDKITEIGYTFQFPFSNNSLTNKLLTFAQLVSSEYGSLNYPGDTETGFTATIRFSGTVEDNSFTLKNETTGKSMTINLAKVANKLGSKIRAGDELVISTLAGYKAVRVRRNGAITNVLTYLNLKASDFAWLTLVPGENRINFQTESPSLCILTIRYPILYEGV